MTVPPCPSASTRRFTRRFARRFTRRFARRFTRRLVGGALFALQAIIAGSWVAEPVGPVRLDAHTEDYGARHLGLHNELTCLACAVRAMYAVPADSPDVVETAPIAKRAEPTVPELGHARRVPGTKRSRAPPAAL